MKLLLQLLKVDCALKSRNIGCIPENWQATRVEVVDRC